MARCCTLAPQFYSVKAQQFYSAKAQQQTNNK